MRTNQLIYIEILLVILFSTILLTSCESQNKNLISFTPLKLITQKVNLHYERRILQNWSGALNVQFWYIDRKGDSFLEREKQDNTNIKNNGIRYSLGIRRYFEKDQNLSVNRQFYIGLNFFTGNHSIKQQVFTNETTLFGITLNSLSKSGNINLRSSGVNFNLGIKTVYFNDVLLDFGVLIGKSWTNHSKDSFLLYDIDSRVSAEEVKFNKKINGLFLEPRLTVGYSF